MLTEVKNQIKISTLSIKYALMREMLNKTTFITNIVFMILNNSSFIIQWLVLFSLKKDIGGYTMNHVLLLWGIATGTYGVAHFFFQKAFNLSDTINTGKLDSYIVQPKNVLISAITSEIETSAIGDIIYAYILLIFYGINIYNFLLFTFFIITGGILLTAISVILNSLSFWFQKTDIIADTGNSCMVNFATYPDGIFKGVAKLLLYTIVPVGIVNYIPVKTIIHFNPLLFLLVLLSTLILILLSFKIFYSGLKKYSSSNLMIAKI